MNMQLRQCFGRANPDFSGYFNFRKKPKVFKKSQNFKIWLQKIQFGNPATQELRMLIKYARIFSIFCYV